MRPLLAQGSHLLVEISVIARVHAYCRRVSELTLEHIERLAEYPYDDQAFSIAEYATWSDPRVRAKASVAAEEAAERIWESVVSADPELVKKAYRASLVIQNAVLAHEAREVIPPMLYEYLTKPLFEVLTSDRGDDPAPRG